MNNNKNKWTLARTVWTQLREDYRLVLPAFHVEPLDRYQSLLQEWNPIAKLMSAADAQAGIDAHVADAWTLIPYCHSSFPAKLLDIGSGGGFPGIPLAMALPELLVTLLDRSERKTAFLKRAALTLNLGNVTVIVGSFPEDVRDQDYTYLTARAVEKPALLREKLLKHVENGATFLCQSAEALPESTEVHVELVEDLFSAQGLRRSRLWLVKSAP